MSPTGDLLVTLIFFGEMYSWACSESLMCCTSMAHCWAQHTHMGNNNDWVDFWDVWIHSMTGLGMDEEEHV